jgi:hypothetical protein
MPTRQAAPRVSPGSVALTPPESRPPSAPSEPSPPDLLRRSPERQRLAEAISCHAEAAERLRRVEEAQRRLHDEFFDRLLPAESEAREALAAAKEGEPARLVAEALGDGGAACLSVADAEISLSKAERKVSEVRRARSLLDVEAADRGQAVEAARHRLDEAVRDAVAAAPEKAALAAEYYAGAKRTLQLARALKTIAVEIRVKAHGLQVIVENDPMGMHDASLGRPDSAWAAAVAALRGDPDAPLPGLPPELEPDPTNDATTAEAA